MRIARQCPQWLESDIPLFQSSWLCRWPLPGRYRGGPKYLPPQFAGGRAGGVVVHQPLARVGELQRHAPRGLAQVRRRRVAAVDILVIIIRLAELGEARGRAAAVARMDAVV